jgi:hypothetical protein
LCDSGVPPSKNPNDLNNTMQQEQKCECCGNFLDVFESTRMVPCYDDGGSVDSFDVETETETFCLNPECKEFYGNPVYSPSECTEEDDLPF